ncbi:DNA polymerase III alpha subunit [hydrothermal vent metagenome]|uniref:DNA polymerase III subunit alpha n=1 Tax=hydrothermal vent metagenome TaxID=652676 RepID=A0A3B0ZAP4_9ZZZZ
MNPAFVHLRVHSEFAMVDSMVRLKPLVKAVAAAGMPAVALTDQSNMFALVKFYNAAVSAGVKPIIGCDIWLHNENEPNQPSHLLLLSKNPQGYRNLIELVSQSYTDGQHHGRAIVRREWVAEKSSGLIALSGGRQGEIGQALLAGNIDEAVRRLNEWKRIFPDSFYLELSRTGRAQEDNYLHQAVDLATKFDTPVVATNEVCFITKDDFEAHELRVCINEGRVLDDPHRPKNYSEQQYLRTPEEMAELFSDIPEALANTVEIAKRCSVEVKQGTYYLPDFPVPQGLTMDEYFRQLSHEGLEKRLDFLFDRQAADFAEIRKLYDERLEIELKVIIDMGFPGYFLIVADFIRWGKNNGVPVGPGRGSGAGSLVAYALDITDLDPLKYDLLFERFLNPERVSMPDFDIDFCMDGRDRVIDYVAQYYGRDKVSQIITYGTMAAKAVVRDVGRVMGHPYGFVDRISKMIPFEPGMTLSKAMEMEPEFKREYEENEEVTALLDMAFKLEGLTRNAGKHAGGVVISPTKLTDFAPLYCEEGGESLVTQFDKNDVESVGLVKFDFLGLRTLTIIDWAIKNIKKATGEEIDIVSIPLDDPISFKLLRGCKTTAVFQLESRGMKDLIKRLQPDSFEDIIALVALFRPGPLQSGMVDNFINRKHGRERVSYPDAQWQHDSLKEILEPTYGIILYQEQVMQIAQVLSGYTLGGADMLRRAMGKKNLEEMAKQRESFEEGAINNGVDGELAMKIFDLVEKFAGYGFNKSHSAAYALVSYQTAWLKAHYPAAFMSAVMSADMDNTDKVVILVDECHEMKLKVVPPDVNACAYQFTVLDEGTVLYGLGAIKGVGEGAIENIINERQQNGPYQDLFDFCRRADLRKVNKRVLEALVRGGAMDNIGPNRATLMQNIETALRMADKHHKDQLSGVTDMFGFTEPAAEEGKSEGHYDVTAEWKEDYRLKLEKETLGLFLTGHPIQPYAAELRNMTTSRIVELKPARGNRVVVAGLLLDIRMINSRRGKMAIITLDDRSARIEFTLFSEALERYSDVLLKDNILVIEGDVSNDEYSGGLRLNCKELYDLAQAREQFAKRLVLRFDHVRAADDLLDELSHRLAPYREGRCPLVVDYHNSEAKVELGFGDAWRIRPDEQLLDSLRQLIGNENVEIVYR